MPFLIFDGKFVLQWFQVRALCMCKRAAAWNLLNLLNMTTKQVETSITINTTARSIFICTTMNSYVQYFQRYIPFAFTIEGSRHSLPHPTPLSYLFHFLSFFFFFTMWRSRSLPILPRFHPLSFTIRDRHPLPTLHRFHIFSFTIRKSHSLPTLPRFHPFCFTIRICNTLPTLLRFHLLSLTIRNSNSLPTLSPAFIYYLWLYQPVTHSPPPPHPTQQKRSVANYTCKMIDKINITIIEHPISPLCFAEVEHARWTDTTTIAVPIKVSVWLLVLRSYARLPHRKGERTGLNN